MHPLKIFAIIPLKKNKCKKHHKTLLGADLRFASQLRETNFVFNLFRI